MQINIHTHTTHTTHKHHTHTPHTPHAHTCTHTTHTRAHTHACTHTTRTHTTHTHTYYTHTLHELYGNDTKLLTSRFFKLGNGFPPKDQISYISIPKLHTSLLELNLLSIKACTYVHTVHAGPLDAKCKLCTIIHACSCNCELAPY